MAETVKRSGVVRFVISWAMLEDLRCPGAVVAEQMNRCFSMFSEVTHVAIRRWGDKPATEFEVHGVANLATATGISIGYEVKHD